MRRVWPLFGTLAPIVYLAAVALGGALRPGYSHVGQAVSELIEAGAPNKLLLDSIFCAYNLLVGTFAIGLLLAIRAHSGSGRRSGLWGAIALLIVSLGGLTMTLFFPMDPRGATTTTAGTLHLVLAGLVSLGTMAALLLVGLWLRKVPGMAGYSRYSLVSLVVVFLTGGLAAGSAASASPLMGVLERLTIGGFLQWLLVIGRRLYLDSPRPAAAPTARRQAG